jgi:hypothetical protein
MTQFINALTFPPEAKIDSKALANVIGHQVVEVCQQELDRAVEEKRDPSRRVLLYVLASAYEGLKGPGRLADKNADAMSFIKKVRDPVTSLIKQLDDPEMKSTEIAPAVEQTLVTLNSILGPKTTPAAPQVAGSNTAKP